MDLVISTTERQFYKRALWLPIVIPLAAVVLLLPALPLAREWQLAERASAMLIVIAISGAYAFIPYLLVALALHRNLSRGERILWGHPLITVLLIPPLTGVVGAALLAPRSEHAWYLIVLGCEFGYPYALLIAAAALIGKKRGWICD